MQKNFLRSFLSLFQNVREGETDNNLWMYLYFEERTIYREGLILLTTISCPKFGRHTEFSRVIRGVFKSN